MRLGLAHRSESQRELVEAWIRDKIVRIAGRSSQVEDEFCTTFLAERRAHLMIVEDTIQKLDACANELNARSIVLKTTYAAIHREVVGV